MITGFNTDVDHDGRVFHVQTEDKGLQNPVVESLVYSGGEIITSRRSSYEELTEQGNFSEEEVHKRMEAQHQALIRDICNGKFDNETPKPFGHNIITNRTLDEVALEYLEETVDLGDVDVAAVERQVVHEGTRPTIRFVVRERDSGRPIEGADLIVRLVSTRDDPQDLFSGKTDGEGQVDAEVDIPEMPGEESALFFEAQVLGRKAENRLLVEKSRRSPQGSPTS